MSIVFVHGYGAMAQGSDTGKLYRNLVQQLGVDSQIPVFYKTSVSVFKRVDLKNEKLRWLGNEPVAGLNAFLTGVDLRHLREDKLAALKGHPLVSAKYQSINSREQPFLELSPVAYSADKNLAVGTVYHWSNPDAASETIYILKKQPSGWKIVRFLVVAIS